MREDSKDLKTTSDAIEDFLRKNRQELPEANVLDQLGVTNTFEFLKDLKDDEPYKSTYQFVHEVTKDGVNLTTVATIDSSDKLNSYLKAERIVDNEYLDKLKRNFNVEIEGVWDMIYEDIYIDSGLSTLEALETEGSVPDKREQSRFEEKFNKIPKAAQEALKDYSQWARGAGKYSGDTGLQLETALRAGLIDESDYDRIIKARNEGCKIIGTPDRVSIPTTFKFWNDARKSWEDRHVYKLAWAIAHSSESNPLEQPKV